MKLRKFIIFILLVIISIGILNLIINNFLPQKDIDAFNKIKHITSFNLNYLPYKYIFKYNLKIKEKYFSGGQKIYYCENRKNHERCFLIVFRNCEDHFLVYEKEGLSFETILKELDTNNELKVLSQKNSKFSYFTRDNIKYVSAGASFYLPGYIKNIEKYDYNIVDSIRWRIGYFNSDDDLIVEFNSGKVYYWDSYKETYLFTISDE